MFTIRFNLHEQKDAPKKYISYSCRAYYVSHKADGEATVRMHFPDGEHYEEQIGPVAPYAVAYVTNSDSRTIDVIRAVKGMADAS